MHVLYFYSDLIKDTQARTFLILKINKTFIFDTLRMFERTSYWKFCEQFLTATYLVRGEIISWCGASCHQTFIKWNLAVDFGKKTYTFGEFIGY